MAAIFFSISNAVSFFSPCFPHIIRQCIHSLARLRASRSRSVPGDVESLPAALPVAGHAGAAGRLALPPVVLADVAGLRKAGRGLEGVREGGREKEREGKRSDSCAKLR